MGILLQVGLEFAFALAGEAAIEVIRNPLDRLLAPLGRALRSPVGGRVLLVVWLVSACWFWLCWTMDMTDGSGWRAVSALVSVFGSAALALFSTRVWRRWNAPPRSARRRAY